MHSSVATASAMRRALPKPSRRICRRDQSAARHSARFQPASAQAGRGSDEPVLGHGLRAGRAVRPGRSVRDRRRVAQYLQPRRKARCSPVRAQQTPITASVRRSLPTRRPWRPPMTVSPTSFSSRADRSPTPDSPLTPTHEHDRLVAEKSNGQTPVEGQAAAKKDPQEGATIDKGGERKSQDSGGWLGGLFDGIF